MSVSKVWQGESSFISGSSTPFGTFDSDVEFASDAPKVANWCATRLGYPIIDIELTKDNIFACFEEATAEYSAQVNQFNIRNNLGALDGATKGENYTGKSVQGSELGNIIAISDAYGTMAYVGDSTDMKRGHIALRKDQQIYDLQELWGDTIESGSRIDVTRVFFEATSAIQRFFDPYSVSGQGTLNLIEIGRAHV